MEIWPKPDLGSDREVTVGGGDYIPRFCPGGRQTQLLVHIPPLSEYDPFTEVEELDRGQCDALAQQQQHGKRMRRGSDSEALDTAVIVGKPENEPGASFSFILEHMGQPTQGMLETHLVSPYQMCPLGCTHMSIVYSYSGNCSFIIPLLIGCPYLILPVSISDYNEVCSLYEAACLKLAVARLSNEHISRVNMAPPASCCQGSRGIQLGECFGR
ncbi:hypothetical protein JCGZ_19319 [Jatropha curcas]|uniref:Uncharacterized protein n=1 Tax=Jatropha curcas TaxID=180498 RepID=A0A067K456_JATCU|nr:hypothetical protein JCGZ_19319 [Jatropha curcas]